MKLLDRHCIRKMKSKVQIIENISAILLGFYIAVLLWITVVGRNITVEDPFLFSPFHTFTSIFSEIKEQGITGDFWGNILLFFPIGFITTFITRVPKIKYITFLGFVVSTVVELSQVVFSRGYFEIDDLITNTIGAFIGALIGLIVKKFLNSSRNIQSKNPPKYDKR